MNKSVDTSNGLSLFCDEAFKTNSIDNDLNTRYEHINKIINKKWSEIKYKVDNRILLTDKDISALKDIQKLIKEEQDIINRQAPFLI